MTLFLWLLGTRPLRSCCGLRKIVTTSAPDGLADTHTILRQELLFYAKLGITISVKHARKQRARRRSNGSCVRSFVRACVRACVRSFVRSCVRA